MKQNWKENTTRHVQVALIIDLNEEMFASDPQSSGLKSLVNKIDSTFVINKGYSSRSYALVSFGHDDISVWIHPQIHVAAK